MFPPTGAVTFLFTDIQASMKLAQEHPDRWEVIHSRHQFLLQAAIQAWHGHIFKTLGDSFCVAFTEPAEAIQAALQGQRALLAEDWGDTPVRVRMGLHTGLADLQPDGDYSGYLTLSRAQRLMAAGHGGQILLSQAAWEQMQSCLPPGISLRNLGTHHLKDLNQPEHIYQVEAFDLPADFPPLKTSDEQLNNLPVQTTPFLGRERELAAILGLLRNPAVRLVVLTGPGGTGKTRLSLQVAAQLVNEYEHGAWFVDLAAVTTAEQFLSTLASTIKVKEEPGTSIEQGLQAFLSGRSLLLVLDNFEQIVAAASHIQGLLQAAPNLKVLVSSREVLHLHGEHTYPVPPLGLPKTGSGQTAAVLEQYEAVALFIQHARQVDPAFALDEENAPAVVEICRQLDGLPLAIELAAARLRLFAPASLLERLKDRLSLLSGGGSDRPGRQQTMRGAIDWSYALLDPPGKSLFARLGIFAGSWSLEAAEAICSDGQPGDMLSGLASLLEKSLIQRVGDPAGQIRFAMLETLRAYARERVTQSGETPAIQARALDYFISLVDREEPRLSWEHNFSRLHFLQVEQDNLRQALDWAFEHDPARAVHLAGGMWSYWEVSNQFVEGYRTLQQALEIDESVVETRWLARTVSGAGTMAWHMADYEQAAALHERAAGLYRQAGDQRGELFSRYNLAVQWIYRDTARAISLARATLQAARESHDDLLVCLSTAILANLYVDLGDYPAARMHYEQALLIARQLNDASMLVNVFHNLGELERYEGRPAEALPYYQSSAAMDKAGSVAEYNQIARAQALCDLGFSAQALAACQAGLDLALQKGEKRMLATGLGCLGRILAKARPGTQALRFLAASTCLREAIQDSSSPKDIEQASQAAETLRSRLSAAEYDLAWQQGCSATVEALVQESLALRL